MPTSIIKLDDEAETRLKVLAEKTGRTKAFYLQELVSGGL
jgi:predicted DNA-binding protein